MIEWGKVVVGDCREQLRRLPDQSFQCCVTSPPYFKLRDYGDPRQVGQESTPDLYVAELVEVFREVRRVLRDDGVLWLNLGDTYASTGGHTDYEVNDRRAAYKMAARPEHTNRKCRSAPFPGLKNKDLIGIPWMAAFALRADGWWLRSDVVWDKPNAMPESVKDRPGRSHEFVFLLTKSDRYFYDHLAVREPAQTLPKRRNVFDHVEAPGQKPQRGLRAFEDAAARRKNDVSGIRSRATGFQDRWDAGAAGDSSMAWRNLRDVWSLNTARYEDAHYAVMPESLVRRCILAASRPGDGVLDPFFGSGTVGEVASSLGRKWWGCELNPDYAAQARRRTSQGGLALAPREPVLACSWCGKGDVPLEVVVDGEAESLVCPRCLKARKKTAAGARG